MRKTISNSFTKTLKTFNQIVEDNISVIKVKEDPSIGQYRRIICFSKNKNKLSAAKLSEFERFLICLETMPTNENHEASATYLPTHVPDISYVSKPKLQIRIPGIFRM